MKIEFEYRIWEVRIEKNLTLEQLAALSGVSKSMINYAENNLNDIGVKTLCKLAKALDVKPETLYRVN